MVDVAKAVIEDLQREGVLQALLLGQNDSHHQQVGSRLMSGILT